MSGGRRGAEGVVLIAVLFVLIVVSITALSLAREVRVELEVSARSADQVQARALLDSAIERVIAELALDDVDGDTLFESWRDGETIFAGIELGAGRYWVFFGEPDPGDGRELRYGARDESAKLNLNVATEEQLLALPVVDEAIVDCLLDWRDSDDEAREEGAERDYYQTLSPGYRPKDGPFERMEELLLVRNIDEGVLYGEDRNLNGLLDPCEDDGDRSYPPDDADGELDRGLVDYLTLVSAEANTTLDGRARLEVGSAQPEEIRQRLFEAGLAAGVTDQVVERLGRRRVESVADLLELPTVNEEELAILADELTTSSEALLPGRVNVNTAPREVLLALGGLEVDAVEAILSRRQAPDEDFSSPAWLLRVMPREQLRAIFDSVTTRSFQHSFQVAVLLGDRGVTRRAEVLVDRTSAPPRVLARRDLTALGFPLPDQRGEDEP